jgi:quercetin dioxygenase-like cupin family protein
LPGFPWHYQNGPVFISVTQGTLTYWTTTCRKFEIKAGQGYIESTGQVLRVKNLDSTTVAEWFTSRVIPYRTNGLPGIDPVLVAHAECS